MWEKMYHIWKKSKKAHFVGILGNLFKPTGRKGV